MSLSGSRVIESARRRQLLFDRSEATTAAVRDDCCASSDELEIEPSRPSLSWERIIPSRRWVLSVACAATLLIGGGVLQAWVSATAAEASEIVAATLERILIGAGSAAWWLTAQLCLLGWWLRSHSRIDYSGRFHAWGWAAGGFFVASVVSLTGLHRLVAFWITSAATPVMSSFTLAWLLPCSFGGLAVWMTLGSELRDCWVSRSLHCLAGVCGVICVSIEFWPTWFSDRLSAGWNVALLSRGLLCLMQWANLWTVLMHLHHLVHVTPDPPERASAWTVVRQQGIDRGWIWLTSRVGREPTLPDGALAGLDAASTADLPAETTPTRRTRREETSNEAVPELRIDPPEPKSPPNSSRRSKKRSKR